MTKLPNVTGRQVIKALKKKGWYKKSQRGSHVKMVNPKFINPVIVPVHSKTTIPKGTLSNIIKDADISLKEFIFLL